MLFNFKLTYVNVKNPPNIWCYSLAGFANIM